jgi:hypothetical protein
MFDIELAIHGYQELFVIPCPFHLLLQEFHRLYRVHVGHVLAQDPNTL